MSHRNIRQAIAMACIAVALIVGGAMGNALGADRAKLKSDIEELNKQTQAFQQLFKKSIALVMPSVVSITTTKEVDRPAMTPYPFGRDPFGRPMPNMPPRMQPERPRQISGLGSGFVVRANGYIVTNYHVVADIAPEDITMIFGDGRKFTAEEVLRDENTEVAVVKIDATNLVPIEWGDSVRMGVGDWVVAIGSPLGLGNTVTTGIVSATSTKDRVIDRDGRSDLAIIGRRTGYAIEDYIQTDAAINPGNSGGPLITLTGKVIGINTLIVSPTRSSAGLGFAVPEKIAQSVVNELIERGRVIRGHLGVRIMSPTDLSDDAARNLFGKPNADEVLGEFQIKKSDKGVLVVGLLPDMPAAKAGIEPGDLIIRIDDSRVHEVEQLRTIIAAHRPDEKVAIIVKRKGREKKLSVVLGEQPVGPVAAAKPGNDINLENFGLKVQTLTPDVAEHLGYERSLKGVVVTEIKPDSPAGRAKLQVNDVILRVNRAPIGNVKGLENAINRIRAKGFSILVKRGPRTLYITVQQQ